MTDRCFWQRHVAEMFRLLGLLRVTLIIRIIVDAIISFVADYQIRRGLFELLQIGGHNRVADSKNRVSRGSSEQNSSARPSTRSAAEIAVDQRSQSVKTIF
uniref:Secreted protein n=1 Tax=Steinernema glaseri TaxID=37863 RepID=A0A1I8AIL0_9BILA